MARRWTRLLALTAALALAAGCGGDNTPSSSDGSASGSGSGSGSQSGSGTAPSTPASAPVSLPGTVNDHGTGTVTDGGSIEMELDDFYFGPTYVTGPAGAKVTVNLHNEGTVNHTFTIDSASIDDQLSPDQKMAVQVTLPASGSLAFYCRFHQSSGMQGAFAIA